MSFPWTLRGKYGELYIHRPYFGATAQLEINVCSSVASFSVTAVLGFKMHARSIDILAMISNTSHHKIQLPLALLHTFVFWLLHYGVDTGNHIID